MGMYKHILLATDLTDDNQVVMDKAAALSKLWDSTLSIIHVVEPLPSYGYAYIGGADIEAQLLAEARTKIASIGKAMGIAKNHQYVEVGPTKIEILRVAKDSRVDLIVLGSHGRHGLALLLGSTANAVLHGADCDVLTVRLQEEAA